MSLLLSPDITRHATTVDARRGLELILRDGTPAVLRPLGDGEAGPLEAVFAGMSAASRASRYLVGLPRLPAGAGTVLPAGRVVAAIVGLSGADQLSATSRPWLAVLAVSRGAGGPDVLVANLESRERLVAIESAEGRVGPGHVLTVHPDGSATWEPRGSSDGRVELPPFGIAVLTSRPEWPAGPGR